MEESSYAELLLLIDFTGKKFGRTWKNVRKVRQNFFCELNLLSISERKDERTAKTMICYPHPLLQFSSLYPSTKVWSCVNAEAKRRTRKFKRCPKNLKIHKPQTAPEQTETAGEEPE